MASPIPLSSADPARLGGWELVGRIGAGGQGVVYLGRPAEPAGRPPRVAVKLLHTQLLGDADARERFVRELALLQRIAGFCTAQVLEADMVGDRPYIVSEYIPGRSLRSLVQDEGPRTGADLDRLAISSVTALSAIHRAGVVHRDFKPQNVLMGPDGPRVIDFGIARAFDAGATMTSQIVGTPAYMAPEQFSGRVEPTTDLFAWASTLLFAATGRDPFAGGPSPAVMYRIINEQPDLRALPEPLAEVAAACLAKDPKLRPSSEDVLFWLLGERDGAARLEALAERLGGSAEPDPAARPAGPAGESAVADPPPPAEPGGGSTWEAWPPPPGQGTRPQDDGPPSGPHESRPHDAGRDDFEPRYFGQGEFGPDEAGTTLTGARRGGRFRPLPRGPALVAGLGLAAVLAALDVAALAILIARPALSEGPRGGLLPVVAASFVVVAVVTLVAAVLAWRGSRAAAGTVMAARVARVAMWGAWGVFVEIDPAALTGHAALTAVVVVLLARALTRRPGPPPRPVPLRPPDFP